MSSSANEETTPPIGDRSTNRKSHTLSRSQAICISLAVLIFLVILWGLPPTFNGPSRRMLAIVASGMVFWITEAIPIGVTAVLIMVLMLLFHPVSMDTVYSGFASPAVFLVTGGMMLATAVNDTRLSERLTYHVLARWGGTAKGLLASVLIIPQFQAFFIPSSGVRTTLLLPFTKNVLNQIGTENRSPLRKMIMLGVAFGGTVSATPVLTGAVGNILTVALVNQILHVKITFVQWFLYAFPLWIAMMPLVWVVLLYCFQLKSKEQSFPYVVEDIKEKLKSFGPLDWQEKKCLGILVLIVGLWVTEPLNGLDPSIPLLVGVVLMVFPGIGCASWSKVVKINFNTIMMLAATLSMGYALNDSGAAKKIGHLLQAPWVVTLMHHKLLALAIIIVMTQLLHLIMSNVSTAVVTLIPIVIDLAHGAGLDPVFVCLVVSLTCLHGYLLVVETLTNIVVYSTGQLTQRDFFIPGLYLTFGMSAFLFIIASTYWRWLNIF